MRVRRLRASDIPKLQQMAADSGYPYPAPEDAAIEAVHVVVDENDQPVMAAAAKRIIELYLWAGAFDHPAAKLHAVRLLHESMAAELQARGYSEANAFLPPAIARKFGRRLERSFGWVRNWASWAKRF